MVFQSAVKLLDGFWSTPWDGLTYEQQRVWITATDTKEDGYGKFWDGLTPEKRQIATEDHTTYLTYSQMIEADAHNQMLDDEQAEAERTIAWLDATRDAALWFGNPEVTNIEAATLLCGFSPNSKDDPEHDSTDETTPNDYKRALIVFKGVGRPLRDWLKVATDRKLRIHSWIKRYLDACKKIGIDTPSTVESSSGAIESGEAPVWIEKAKAIAQRIGTGYWHSSQRQITSRNIAGAVATELAKDTSTYGLQGPRGEDNVRNVGLKGWVFTPPTEAQSVD